MKRSKSFVSVLLVVLAYVCSANAQSSGWKVARGAGLKFEVPSDFTITSGTGPGHLGDAQSLQMFELHYLTAANTQRFIFASAGYGYVQVSPYFRGTMEDLAAASLSNILQRLTIPNVAVMELDLPNAEVSEYKTMGIQVSETKAVSLATHREYRVYFALAFREAGPGRAKMVYMVTGCPEAKIDETNQVLSTILASFKEP
jgi:hypothetical protein